MKFLSPKGAVKDAKELEYLTALHQTTHDEFEEFRNGSIDDEDVRTFLMSSFGIKVTNEQVREYIFKGLAGGDGEDETLDILEIVAILMIPIFVKVSASVLGSRKRASTLTDDQKLLLPPETIIADVLQDILSDATDGTSSTSNPPSITPHLLRKIFVQYDELDLVKDDKLIDEMIAVASENKPGATLDVAAFARALSADVQLYNPQSETRYTEVFTDVFPAGVKEVKEEEMEEKESCMVGDKAKSMKKVFTLSHMDYTADTFVHSLHVTMLWLVIVFSYFFYMLGVQDSDFLASPSDGFGYKVGYAILRWLLTMTQLVIIGGGFGFFLGLGNGLPQKFIGPVLGLIAVAGLAFLPAFLKGANRVFSTDLKNNEYHELWPGMGYILVCFGIVLVLLQIKNLFDYFMPSFEHSKVYAIVDGIAVSNTQRAYRSKQAGIFKLNQLVRNAHDLHKQDEKSQERSHLKSGEDSNQSSTKRTSSKTIALQKYADQLDELEEVGGLVWSVKEYYSGRMAGTEGIWLPSRLLAANAIQFVASIVIITAAFIVFYEIIDGFYPKELPDSVIESNTCFTTFDYDKCYFPFEEFGEYTGVAVCRDVSLEGPECIDLLESVNNTDGPIKGLIVNTCDSLDAAFAKVEEEVTAIIGYNCSTVLGAAEEYALQFTTDELSQTTIESNINVCYAVNTMTSEDIEKYNEWFADDQEFPTIDGELLENCQSVQEYMKAEAFSTLAPGFEESAFQAYQTCMDVYGSIKMENPCERNLSIPKGEIYAYEEASDGDNFCVSYLSACYIDRYKPTRATCIIGGYNYNLFQFDGPTCETYPRINDTLVYYQQNVPQAIDLAEIYPEKWTLRLTALMSIIAGALTALITTAAYIPSSIHTILKFRSGVIPSLKDPNFLKYRRGLVNQTYMIGAMFWGLVVTTLMVTILVAVVVFLFVQPFVRGIVIDILAQVLGIAATIILRTILCMIFLRTAYAGFYRKMPAFANAFMFAVECWNIGLTILSVIVRVAKFLLATSLYAGRIDRPVLAEGLALDIDSLPRMFRQNLLSAEAHRHPYLIQLGQMYMMKLRHKDDFGTKAGSIWRLLFVSALMPWLRKKRIQDDVAIDVRISSRMESSRQQDEPERNPRRSKIGRASFQMEP